MVESTNLWEGQYIAIRQNEDWEYVTRIRGNSAVVIIAVTDENNLLLVEQPRLPLNQNVVELPAGLVADEDADETVMQAAARELLEETGYQAEFFESLISGPVSAGLSDEIIHLVRARNIVKVQDGGGVDGEQIIVHEIPCNQLYQRLKEFQQQGKATDPKILTALGVCLI